MAEGLLFSVATEILLKLGSYANQQIALARGAKDEMKKLESTMTTITNIILDAEEKQVTDRAVKEWMQRLKDLVYEIEELLDEFATEALLRQVEGGAISKIKNSKVFNSYNIGRKTKNMRKKLDEVVADMKVFNFIVKTGERPFEFRRREDTSSFVRVPEVIGRDRDKEDLIKNLIHANSQDLLVLPIVGMGGLGKTTLAQLVFNDNRIVRHFTQRIWVCVSDNFNINTIIANILKAAGDNEVNEKFELEILQARLRQKLLVGNLGFFLVLDDVWNEDRVKWGQLRDLLIVDGRQSAVLVTTRSRVVASIMGTIHSYDVRGLSDEDCLCVLGKWAFNEGSFERRGNLVKIGEEIVKKCGGVPLAVRSLGCLLYMKTDERDWCRVRDNEIWTFVQKENDVLSILKLSYDQLPHSLKNCFAYLSIFQKDEVINKWQLIYMWSAQGFIRPSNSNEELEVTGERYLNELVLRSFLDKHNNKDDCYRMHDLFHDLALYVAGDEFFCLRSGVEFIPDGVRHVSIAKEFHSTSNDAHPIESLLQGKKMRTFLVRGDNFKLTKISSYKHLRVFHTSWANRELSSLIFNGSNHLRYLDFQCPDYSDKDSFTRLVNLQYLSLSLRLTMLGNLVSLRYLSIISDHLDNLPEEEIVRLISLRVLIVNMPYLKSLPEGIYRLTFLRVLEINNCDVLKSLPLGLRLLGSLEHLSLIWCKHLEISNDDLQGLKSLKSLKLEVIYRLLSLPEGLYTDTAASLEYMEIRYCFSMESMLLNFANFTSLKKLEILSCTKLSSLPQGLESLTTLQSVSIKGCPLLYSRCQEGGEDWAKISCVPHLVIDEF